jgi:cysteine-S-conjugate beta-lyase
MHPIFDRVPNRRNSDSTKWLSCEIDVLPMWLADMDFPSPPAVQQALRERAEHGYFGYPREDPGLCAAFRAWLKERYDWEVQPEEILLLPGVVAGFNQACHAFDEPGGAVLIQPPVYPPFLKAAGLAGLQRQDAPWQVDAQGASWIDLEAFAGAMTNATRLFILCNPHNPNGRVLSRQELEGIAQACLEREVVIVSDEIHADLVFSGQRHIPIATLSPEIAQNTITLMAPSKTFNIAGLQCAFAIIQNPRLRRLYQRGGQGLVSWVNLMGQTAALAAYTQGRGWLAELMVYLEGNRDYLYDFVQGELPGIRMHRPQGTYLAWLDCRALSLENPGEFFLKQARISLVNGAAFGPGGEGFVRFNFGCPRSMLEEALERMKKAL